MIQLIYVSERALLTNEKDIQEILTQARVFNQQHQITGLLVCLPNHFYQLLEGNRDQVHKLMDKIKQDSRHINLMVLTEKAIKHRDFGLWSMAHSDIDEDYGESFHMLNLVAQNGSRIAEQVEGVRLVLKGLKPL